MARDLPPPTPEGALIRRVRESMRPRMAVAAAAERAGVSAETWGNVERGYRKPRRDVAPVRVVATPSTLSHMAYAIGLQPDDLRKVGRGDAADILAEMYGPELEVIQTPVDDGIMLIAVPPGLGQAEREKVKEVAEDLAKYLDDLRQDHKK